MSMSAALAGRSAGAEKVDATHLSEATLGKDLEAFSLETVQMFHRDAVTAGFTL